MIDDLGQRLARARGYSEFVIALNLDIREFSNWSLSVDSAQTALFVKKIYGRLIDRFFADAAFVKPTGDGLFVIIDFDEDSLGTVVQKTVKDSMAIVKEFGSLCADDPIVNFDVPQNVGIGIARGAASRLAADDTTLDYSGRTLNLASRLMDIARPKGVVFDGQLGASLLDKPTRSKFKEQDVYLKGVSPRTAVKTMCWPDEIEIEPVNQFPIGDPQWKHVEETNTLRTLSRLEGDDYFVFLREHPSDVSTLMCNVLHDSVTPGGRRSKEFNSHFEYPVEYIDDAGEPRAKLDIKALVARLRDDGVGPTWPVTLKISYRLV